MPKCYVLGCRNNTTIENNNNIRYYSFPKSPSNQIKWLKACGKNPGLKIKNGRYIFCFKSFKYTSLNVLQYLTQRFQTLFRVQQYQFFLSYGLTTNFKFVTYAETL